MYINILIDKKGDFYNIEVFMIGLHFLLKELKHFE